MPLVLQPDPSVAGFNAYCSLAEANAYHEARLHNTAWTSAVDATKNAAIVWATNTLDTLTWRGVRYSGDQLHEFPRKGLSWYETDDGSYNGGSETSDLSIGFGFYTKVTIPESTVPTQIKNATAELAFWLIDSDTTAPTGTEGFNRIKVDVIDIHVNSLDRQDWLNPPVRSLVHRFLKQSNRYTAPVVRVG